LCRHVIIITHSFTRRKRKAGEGIMKKEGQGIRQEGVREEAVAKNEEGRRRENGGRVKEG